MKVRITRLGHQGDGIADGPLYVPRALPGECIEGTPSGNRLDSPRILTPSPDRVRAPCPHYNSCGGCALQHASDSFVAGWKEDIVRRALDAQGISTVFRQPHISPPNSRRRAALAGRRLKKSTLVGFHRRSSHDLVEVPECRVLDCRLLAAFPALGGLTAVLGSRQSVLRFSVIASDTGIDVDLEADTKLDPPQLDALAKLAEANGLARLSLGGDIVLQRSAPVVSFEGIDVVPPPGAFLQATSEGQRALWSAVSEATDGARAVCDLFAGCGTFALPMAKTSRVHAVESGADMLAALDAGWRHAPFLKQVTTEARDLFRNPLTVDELSAYDAIIVDPPRAGGEAQFREIARSGVRRVAAVSCNPVSFARDARILTEGGYRLDWVQVVDQFRWSPHVELAAAFSMPHMPSD